MHQILSGQLSEIEAVDRLWRQARAAFGQATAVYAGSMRYAASTITAERNLRRPT